MYQFDKNDRKAHKQSFNPGDKVLILLPIHGYPLQAQYSGLYLIEERQMMWTM